MKIFCHIPREDWFCDRFGREYLENSNNTVSHTNLDCDLIWIMAGWCWKQIPVEFLKSKKVVCTIHHEVPEKFKDEIKKKSDVDFLLNENRRIFKNEVHYFDHPRIGVIISVYDSPL